MAYLYGKYKTQNESVLFRYPLTKRDGQIKNSNMQTLNKAYKFIGKVLPDGHLSIPAEIARDTAGKEFEVLMTPIDDIKSSISLYLEGRLEKKGCIKDLSLDSAKIEDAVKKAFGTTNIDVILRI